MGSKKKVKKPSKTKAKKEVRRVPKVLSDTMYCYVRPANGKHARTKGAEMFGSFSAYVDALISKDRGVKPALGKWKAEGESKKLRKTKPKKAAKKVAKKATAKAKKITVKTKKAAPKKARALKVTANIAPAAEAQSHAQHEVTANIAPAAEAQSHAQHEVTE